MIDPVHRSNLLFVAGATLLLVLAAYCFGRRDAPGKQDIATKSLLDGVKAYKRENDSLRAENRKIEQERDVAIKAGKAHERYADSVKTTRVAVPTVVPAACHGWALNLSKCDEEQAALRQSLGATREALDATARLKAMGDQRQRRSEARADSLTQALRKARDGDYVLGVKLPSRATSFAIGGVLGAVVGLVVSR